MIQVADVGIGIVGKEGKQAALAADYSILQFKYIKCLLLWHGRLAYKRTALLASFVIERGMIISIMQVIFSVSYYFVTIAIYNGMLMLGYTTAFTSLPVFTLILDEDVDKQSVFKFEKLYESLLHGRECNTKQFVI